MLSWLLVSQLAVGPLTAVAVEALDALLYMLSYWSTEGLMDAPDAPKFGIAISGKEVE